MESKEFKYVFGPVASRRLGRSLGVDVVPFKTCTYDCIYCQLGATTRRTVERREYVPLETLLDELRRKFDLGVQADFITIAGSGEPTLYSRFGELIDGIKALTDTPVDVLTNGSLFWREDVRNDLRRADVVIPSLDAPDAALFARVNRPDPAIGFDRMLEGLEAFRDVYEGRIWLEVFLLDGITALDAEIDKFESALARIRPDRIQLNTVARPAPGSEVRPVPRAVLEKWAARLGPKAEIVAHGDARHEVAPSTATQEEVLAVIQRHPCTIENLAAGLSISVLEAEAHVASLLARAAIRADAQGGTVSYIAI